MMPHRHSLLLLASAILAAAAPPLSSSAMAQTANASVAEGTWAGDFGQSRWTVELRNEGGSWTGRYMSSKVNVWRPLYALVVKDRAVTFNIKSEPQINFVLAVDASNNVLAGEARIADRITLPFSAARQR